MTMHEEFEHLNEEWTKFQKALIEELQIERLVRWLDEKLKGTSL